MTGGCCSSARSRSNGLRIVRPTSTASSSPCYERWTFTPYDVELTVDGPLAPAQVTAQLVRIQVAWNTSPLGGREG
jgi:hypothetical protein